MTRNDIATALCSRIPEIQKSTALHVVDATLDIIADAFAKGENVYLRGFGTLEVKHTAEKIARNINTGEPVIIPAGRTVKLRLSDNLKKRINNGTVD